MTVAIVPENNSYNWNPQRGASTNLLKSNLLKKNKLDEESFEEVNAEAVEILRRCNNPNENTEQAKTVLAIGKVQSGKTLSFTNLIALAADNNIRIIICLSGSTKVLASQNFERLKEDLNVDDDDSSIDIIHYTDTNENEEFIFKSINDDSILNPKKTVILTTLKHHAWIEKTKEMFEKFSSNSGKKIIPLIISDEADHIEVNSKRENVPPATTWEKISELRQSFPQHSYVQYTATPSALLLQRFEDWVTPDDVVILNPGEGYCGGKEFFDNTKNNPHYFKEGEPPKLIIRVDDHDHDDEVPESLKHAIYIFVLGITDYYLKSIEQGKSRIKNRSMLVHPSRLKVDHSFWKDSVRKFINNFDNPLEFIQKDLLNAYEELSKTVYDLKSFEELTGRVKEIAKDISVQKVNSDTDIKNWKEQFQRNKASILIGGDIINRGFTVEGLVVTYMTRTLGTQDDTIQQRARFFGYKKEYLNYCRIFLNTETIDHFTDFVDCEEYLHQSLKKVQHKIDGKEYASFKAWLRENLTLKLVPGRFLPSNRNKIKREFDVVRINDRFITINHPSYCDEQSAKNIELCRNFLKKYESRMEVFKGKYTSKTPSRTHRYTDINSSDICDFINRYEFRYDEKSKFQAAIAYLESINLEKCRLFEMSYGELRGRDSNSFFVFQGKAQSAQGGINAYPGDRGIFHDSFVTLHLYRFQLSNLPSKPIIFVPAIKFPSGSNGRYIAVHPD